MKNDLTEKINNQKFEMQIILKAFEETKFIKLAAKRFKMNFGELTLKIATTRKTINLSLRKT